MQSEPENKNKERGTEQEEYRRRAQAKAKRRKKRRNQKLMLLGAFVLFIVLVVVSIVMIVKTITAPKEKESSRVSGSSMSASTASDLPLVANPVAPDASRWELVLINQTSPMPAGFAPETQTVSIAGHQFDARAAQYLLDMVAACNNATEGNSLEVFSALRGEKTQNKNHATLTELFKSQGDDEATADQRAREVDPPYPMSDHQTALGVDFITKSVANPELAFANTAEFVWLTEHAAEYGFVLRFPDGKEAITGITYQPYHFRYVGVEDAKIISAAGICLEEYVVQLSPAPPASAQSTAVSGDASGSSSKSA